MAKKYYAVVKGRSPGIYNRWEGGAQNEVNGFPGARFRGFALEEEARHWYRSQVDPDHKEPWELVNLDGFCVMIMLRPHLKGRGGLQMLGTGIYDVETEQEARDAALLEYWKEEEHSKLGTPYIEVHFTPEHKVPSTSEDKHTSHDFEL